CSQRIEVDPGADLALIFLAQLLQVKLCADQPLFLIGEPDENERVPPENGIQIRLSNRVGNSDASLQLFDHAFPLVGEIEVGPVMIVDSIAPARIQIRLGAFASLTD